MSQQKTKTGRPRKYPGHRSCFNHEIIFEMLKRDVPELCPKCFAGIAAHQVQLIALNYARAFRTGNMMIDLKEEIAELHSRIENLEERAAQ